MNIIGMSLKMQITESRKAINNKGKSLLSPSKPPIDLKWGTRALRNPGWVLLTWNT